jgi:hypothetical protein
VPVFGCEYHLLDGGHLGGRELAGAGARARGAVVEATGPTIRSINARGRNGPALAMARRMPALAAPSGSR